MTAIKEHIENKEKSGGKLKISMKHFEAALNKIKAKNLNSTATSMMDSQSFPTSGSLT
jgi:SpoVK/Ycf46/Vps4 family AAA+-type ATPase